MMNTIEKIIPNRELVSPTTVPIQVPSKTDFITQEKNNTKKKKSSDCKKRTKSISNSDSPSYTLLKDWPLVVQFKTTISPSPTFFFFKSSKCKE